MAEVISSTANPRVKSIRELHGRKRRRARHQTLIEGPVVFAEFVEAAFEPVTVLCTQDDLGTIDVCHRARLGFTLVTDEVLAAVSDTQTPQSPVAVIDIPRVEQLRLHDTLILVDIQDPGNVGTMIRTAAALDWDVGVVGITADVWAPKTVRSGAGAHAHVRLVDVDRPLATPAEHGLTTVAAVVSGGASPHVQDRPVALLVGSEAHGLPADLTERADGRITIPMPGGTESLNVATAAAIAMYSMSDLASP